MSDGGLQWHAEVGAQEEYEAHSKGIGMENRKVYEAINKVQKELATEGIGKGRRNQQQGYNFRGIDDIYNAVSPLLAKHGLCILPRVISRECIERQSTKGGALFYVTCAVEFDFVSSTDGSTHVVKMWGEAMDSGDKATNKAMSAAYKYAVMQAFAIPTEGDNDADSTTHEVAPDKGEFPLADHLANLDAAANVADLQEAYLIAKKAAVEWPDAAAFKVINRETEKCKAVLEGRK